MRRALLIFLGITLLASCTIKSESNKNDNEEIESNSIEDNIQSQKDDVFQRYLNEPENLPNTSLIKIYKEARALELYGDDKLIARFKIVLGQSPKGHKTREGDKKTPEGKYYICTRNDISKFSLFLGISYPNIKDAKGALEEGRITQREFNQIERANINKALPNWYTGLGGEVGIHGGGISSDWTWGCIALSDEDIKILWKYAKLKTPVEIYR